MSIFATTFSTVTRVATALLAQDCYVCGDQCGNDGNAPLCAACASALPRLPTACCPVCALPTTDGATCGQCLKDPPHYDATVAPFVYAFPIEHLVQALKYQSRLPLAAWFALALLKRLKEKTEQSEQAPLGVDCIMPLPLHALRLKQRGYNQAMEIARPLANALAVPLLWEACLRERHTVPQTSLPWKARGKNVRDAFHCQIDLTGKTVAVVDDVMTTGTTLNELARTLKKHGAARVINYVVARTLKQ